MATAATEPQFASLYVGDLHQDVTEAMLYEIFNAVGPVASIRVCRDTVSRRSLGYGYINFHGVSDAERAIETLNYSSIKGRACRIMWSQRDPSLRKSGLGNVFVKNLDRNIDNKALYDTFSLFGSILSCKVESDQSGRSRGYGFVHYETEDAARQAVERVNGMQIGSKTVQVGAFMKRGQRDKPEITKYTNLYVKQFPQEWEEEQLSELFSSCGKISACCVMMDKQDRKFAFVNFETVEGAKEAVDKLHGSDVRSEEAKAEDAKEGDKVIETLYVQRAQTKAERKAELREKFPQAEKPVPVRAQGVNLYIKNLDEGTDDDTLKILFEPFGSVTSAAVMKDERGRCKGFGFLSFASPEEATKAVTEMHLKVVNGKPLYVGLAEKREARQERLRQRYNVGAVGSPSAVGGACTAPLFGGGSGGCMQMAAGLPEGGAKAWGKGGLKGEPGSVLPQGCVPLGGCGMPPQMMGMMYPGMPRPGGQQGMMYPPQMFGRPPMMGPRGPMVGFPPQMMAQMGKGMPGMPGMPCGLPACMGPMAGKAMMGMPGMMRPQTSPQLMQQAAMLKGGACAGAQMTSSPTAPQPTVPGSGGASPPLTAAALAAATAPVQKQMIGEKLYPLIAVHQPELAGKITGMMLEMDNSELLMLLETEDQLKFKVDEAMRVLETTRP
eukprot:TRINITY_DN2298_c0_g1_i1.p1 TRINITY_DN2298_c0_g1~~TRINITY_DN2298_c0_g1_i1.p1  ORF type:complete len:666 (-),score=141.10 TRINITY_DN2298_c0_g1_i1:178-2175(-)